MRVLECMKLLKNIVWTPLEYIEASVISREASIEMLSRMDWMTLKPKTIVDIGCGTGEMSIELQKRYPDAHLLAFDLSQPMLDYAKKTVSRCVCADAERLPLRDQSVDLIFANFLTPWHTDLRTLLREWRRVLHPNGILMFTALGPDTLKEWRVMEDIELVPQLIDMHDIGDILLAEKFSDPVLDVSHYITTYRDKKKLTTELLASGMLIEFPENWNDFFSENEDRWTVSYEVIYAHAFAPLANEFVEEGVTKIPLANLRQAIENKK